MMIGNVLGPTGSEMKLSWICVACQMKKAASAVPMPPKDAVTHGNLPWAVKCRAARAVAATGRKAGRYLIRPISREMASNLAIESGDEGLELVALQVERGQTVLRHDAFPLLASA